MKTNKRKPVHVSEGFVTDLQKLATKRDWTVARAADHVLKVGFTRIKALKTYATASRKAA